MIFQFNILFFVAAAPGLLIDNECENQDISDQCFAECRLDYLSCRAECQSSLCDSQCLEDFQNCESSCPCSVGCPSGCRDCPDHPLCNPHSTTEATTTVLVPIEPSEVRILVIMPDLRESYLTSGDGEDVAAAKIDAPTWDFTAYSRFALVEEKLHIFGGWSDSKKIARLEGCTLIELSVRLNEKRDGGSEALSINDGSQALVCFNTVDQKSCEIFDGSKSTRSFSTTFTHESGGLGLYKNQPATVGCYSDHTDAETLQFSGWSAIPDQPEAVSGHSLIGLQNGAMLQLGGKVASTGAFRTAIWQLKDDFWTRLGDLQQSTAFGATIRISRSIYYFAGSNSPFPVHRIDLGDNEDFEKVELIGNHDYWNYYPVLYQTFDDSCKTNYFPTNTK